MHMKVKKLLLVAVAALLLAGCYKTQTTGEMGPEVDRKLVNAVFEKTNHTDADTSLIKLDQTEESLDLPEGLCLSEMLYGQGIVTDNLFIEHRVIANESGVTAVLLRDIPYFILIDAQGNATCYPDFRLEPLPLLKARKGRDLSVEPFKPICATHTGFITDKYLALLTPALRSSDWDISGPWRYLDFYCLKDGHYIGSAEIPLGDSETQWIYDLELRGEELLVHYTDMNQSSSDYYRFSVDLEEDAATADNEPIEQ